jgi:hypothetical protein
MKKSTKKIIVNTLSLVGGSLVGNVAGAALSSVANAAPLVGGIGVAGLSLHLTEGDEDKEWMRYLGLGFGAGMITAPTPVKSSSEVKGLSGFEGAKEDAKTNAMTAFESMAAKLYLHKTPLAKYISPATTDEQTKGVDGLGEMSDEEAQNIIDKMMAARPVQGIGESDPEETLQISGVAEGNPFGLPEESFGEVGVAEMHFS